MRDPASHPSRRSFLAAAGVTALTAPGAFADQLLRTPPQTEGPFYPDKLPLDTDNDLILVNSGLTPAVGDITHLTGRVLGPTGTPIKNAVVEIWQCDANQVYLHTSDSGPKKARQDANFQGFGRFTTGSKGEYYFRTIKPVPYPGRNAPHIHVKVKKNGRDLLTTQFFIAGHPGNDRDGVVRGLRDPLAKELVMVDFTPVKGSKVGELAAVFEIVVGRTPTEDEMEGTKPAGGR